MIALLNSTPTIASNNSVYAIGLEHELRLSPVIINLTKETYFKSKLKLDTYFCGSFFNRKNKEFILVRNDPMTSVKIYRVDIKSDKLSKPYFEYYLNKNHLQYRQAIWSESLQTLYIASLKDNNKTRGVLLTILDFKNNTVKHIDLSKFISIDKSIYTINNRMLMIGYKTDIAAKKGHKPDSCIIIELGGLIVSNSNFNLNSMFVEGIIDNAHIAVSDNNYLYSYDFVELTKLIPRQTKINKIFGLLNDNKCLYAQITQSWVVAERDILVSIPLNKPSKYTKLFKGENPWTISDSFIANTDDIGF